MVSPSQPSASNPVANPTGTLLAVGVWVKLPPLANRRADVPPAAVPAASSASVASSTIPFAVVEAFAPPAKTEVST